MIGLFLVLSMFFFPVRIWAVYDPLSVPNNKYGIHIADFNDITDTVPLINSNGGDWGYITLVSTDSDRKASVWQPMFDQMRRKHIIPIVRIATHVERDYWTIPNPVDFDSIVSFFNTLNWPIKNRYIILYNEPNHAKEWGNTINPEEYARIYISLYNKFKHASEDFFILPAGLDAAAASSQNTLELSEYIRRMVQEQPEIIRYFDGWTSHSYPNPGFSAPWYATGKGSLRSYIWELGILRSYGLTKSLPVFITETGWTHSEGKNPNPALLSTRQVALNITNASTNVWNDPEIVAVTPFVFNYQDIPFDIFSWKKYNDSTFYEQYFAYSAIAKLSGKPLQNEVYVLKDPLFPSSLITNSTYTLSSQITNYGQGILDDLIYDCVIESTPEQFIYLPNPLPNIEPKEQGQLSVNIKTPQQKGTYRLKMYLKQYDRKHILQERDIVLVPPPSLLITIQLGWKRTSNANNISVLIYDNKTLIQKFEGLQSQRGTISVEGITNIIPDKLYRVVVLVPNYLPRQVIIPINNAISYISPKRLLPFDINNDGTISFKDIAALFRTQPQEIIKRFISP